MRRKGFHNSPPGIFTNESTSTSENATDAANISKLLLPISSIFCKFTKNREILHRHKKEIVFNRCQLSLPYKKSRLKALKGTNFCDYNRDFYKKLRLGGAAMPANKIKNSPTLLPASFRDSAGTRTQNPQLRRLMLYPVELPNPKISSKKCCKVSLNFITLQ